MSRPRIFVTIRSLSALAALVLIAAGCGKSEPVAVSGAVTLNGEVVNQGTIRFEPAYGGTDTAEGSIVEGKYTAQVLPGAKRVRITGSAKIENRKHEVTELAVPATFNTESTLSTTIARKKTSTKDFDLKAP